MDGWIDVSPFNLKIVCVRMCVMVGEVGGSGCGGDWRFGARWFFANGKIPHLLC